MKSSDQHKKLHVKLHRGPDAKLWQQAISDANAQIAGFKRRIRGLENAIETFKGHIQSGEPWPGRKAS